MPVESLRLRLIIFRILSSFQLQNKLIGYTKPYTYGLDQQLATAYSTVKSNYFRFATITLLPNFMHNELSNIVDVQTV